MQAIRITSFLPETVPHSALKPTVVPRPKPTGCEILVRITHVSLQQVDLLFARGKHQNNNAKKGHILPPFILGLDFAGVVEAVPLEHNTKQRPELAGGHDMALRRGDRVMGQCYGCFAEYVCVRPEQLRKIPTNLDLASASTLVGGVVSYGAFRHLAKVKPGQMVLVTGANGGLGVVACQIARASGAEVIALVSSADRAMLLKEKLSLEHVVSTDGTDWIKEIKGISKDGGVDVVIDNIGLVHDGLRCLKFGGRIVVVGFAGRNGVMEKIAVNRILLKGATIMGYRFGEQMRHYPERLEQAWQGYYDLLQSGKVKAVMDEQAYQGIEDIPRALQDLADRKVRGRAVVSLQRPGGAKL